ncbi:MAG: alpha/beta fold hydrolase [Actinobacteria bacterium]|nr:alpha/beta fold hydrolase [Actinomycetota bacterium]
MSRLAQLGRAPRAALEFTNILLTTSDAEIGCTPRDLVWSHRKTSLYRYRSANRRHPIPILLVFALINRPEIFDLRPGQSLVEDLLAAGFDVYLLDWGELDEEDGEMGLAEFVCDELHWAVRETLYSSGQEELTLVGWCIGGTLVTMYLGLEDEDGHVSPVRNAMLLTTPIEAGGTLYLKWVGGKEFDVDFIADNFTVVPGGGIDLANKLMKPVKNLSTTYRQLWEKVLAGEADRVGYQSMAKWVAANPPFPSKAFREWVTWIYKENRLAPGKVELRGRRVDLRRIDQNLLVVTAGSDHITPREGTEPVLDLVSSEDVTHLARPGGHIGLVAGSKAKRELWPSLVSWLEERSAA